jgi:late competence protein required for DNA uptake (superfamily II DNA/RNA helicase)
MAPNANHPMPKNFPKTGKRTRPKTAIKGKRFHCARCHKRSPKPVLTPAPWYCPTCLQALEEADDGF